MFPKPKRRLPAPFKKDRKKPYYATKNPTRVWRITLAISPLCSWIRMIRILYATAAIQGEDSSMG